MCVCRIGEDQLSEFRYRSTAMSRKRPVSHPAGYRASMVQIGLGNNRTFIYNFKDEQDEDSRRWSSHIHWLLGSCSIRSAEEFFGVAVEPVAEYARGCEEFMREREL